MPSNAHESEAPPAEAVLIRRAREARGLSPEQAAGMLKIKLSGRRWRQLEDAKETGKPGAVIRIGHAQLAHMAYVVGVTPEQLEDVGRQEAAAVLRDIERQAAQLTDSSHAEDSLTVEKRPEIPAYVDLDAVEPWEREIWERLFELSVDDKEMMIVHLTGIFDRRRKREAGESPASRRNAG